MKPIIKPFDSGWNYIQHASFKLISLLVIWSWEFNNMLKKKVTSLPTSVIQVCQITLKIIPHLISKPNIRKHKNHIKVSNDAGKFAQNLRAWKKSQYNGRHFQRHTFRRRKSNYKSTSTNIPSYGLKVKGVKNEKNKPPSPCRQILKLHVIKHCRDIFL